MGGKNEQEVYDFLMSIDYGICYGPVDQFNQVWVKDKPIWCGAAHERMDVEINQPELFGGDRGEGGVVGTVEVYTGTEHQLSSAQLAGRVGRHIYNMPGYRDIAHLFFRGNIGSEEPKKKSGAFFGLVGLADPLDTSGIAQQIPASGGLLSLIVYNLFKAADKRGFRWTTNNPYLPTMKTSVTRLPKSLPTNFMIYPPILDENGNPVYDPLQGGTTPENLVDFGLPSDQTLVYNRADLPAQEGQFPWSVTGFASLTLEEYDAGIEAGWQPRAEVIQSRTFKDASESPVFTEVVYVAKEYDIAFNELATHTFTASGLSPTFVEVFDLNPATRHIKHVMTVQGYDGGGAIPDLATLDGETLLQIKFKVGDGGPAFGKMKWTASANPSFEFEGTTVDLHQLGFSQETIDNGGVKFAADALYGAWESPLGGGEGHNWTGEVRFGAYQESVEFPGEPDYSSPGFLLDSDGVVQSSFPHSGVTLRYVPMRVYTVGPGVRFVSFLATKYHALPLFSFTTTQKANWIIYGAGTTISTTHCNVDKTLGILPDANPAQMIYECLVNVTWGKGEDPAMINTGSFLDAANTLADEFFGLSMAWFSQDSIENFVQEILDHIQAFLYQDPSTGLWNLKLLRGDYSLVGAKHVHPGNADLTGQKRKAWGETINEIVVSYTDPETEKEATVTSHNLGNIAMNGGVISETRNYYGIRNPILAKIVADRDVEAAGYPVFTCQAEVDRSFWNVRPGDVVTLSWAEQGLTNAVMRVMGIDYGSPTRRVIKLDLSEDIFALEQTSYAHTQGGLLESERVEATPLDHEMVITAPLPAMVRAGATIEEVDAGNPTVAGIVMGDNDPKPTSIEVHTEVVKANGSLNAEKVTVVPPTPSTALEEDLVAEASSVLSGSVVELVQRGNQDFGDLLMIGSEETGSEIVMLNSFNEATSEWTVARGVWDTVPVAWLAGSRIWSFSFGASRVDPTERAAGETRNYRLLPKTSFNRLRYDQALDVVASFTERPFAPFRPANCQLDGTGFVGIDYSIQTTTDPLPATILATWSNRNRTTEDRIISVWGDMSTTPEVGQTTVLRIFDDSGVFSHEITGLTGESYAIPSTAFAPVNKGTVQFVSERDGVRSLWGIHIPFDITRTGYGLKYGLGYGI